MASSEVNPVSGIAVFSTRRGEFKQRQAVPNMRIVLRSDPREDRDTMAARLQAQFAKECKAITAFPLEVGDYFDGYDQEVHGFEFLRAVLLHIAAANARHAGQVQDYVTRWMSVNWEAFSMMTPEHTSEHLFIEEDINDYGKEFLEDATIQIKCMRANAHLNDPSPDSIYFQQQHQSTMNEVQQNFRKYSISNIPRPADPSARSNLRTTSDPVQHLDKPWHGHTGARPSGQLAIQQVGHPLQWSHPYPRALEHVHRSQPRVPSNPGRPYMGIPAPASMAHFPTAFPPGFAGYSNYGSQKRPQMSARQWNYRNEQSMARKNPVRKSSDDARKEGHQPDSGYQTSNRRGSSQLYTSKFIQSPQPIPSSTQFPFYPSYPPSIPHISHDRFYYRGHLGLEGPSSTQNAAFPSPIPGEDRPPARAQIDQKTLDTVVSSPNRPPDFAIAQEPLVTASYKTDTAEHRDDDINNGKHQSTTDHLQVANPVAPDPSRETFDPDTPKHKLRSETQSASQASQSADFTTSYKSSPYTQDPGQTQSLETPIRSSNRGSPTRASGSKKGSKLWIGGFPADATKAMVLKMLEGCNGLLSIGNIRTSNASFQASYETYVFAEFQSHPDAQETLNCLPCVRIEGLPGGQFLKVGWPRGFSTPRHQQKAKADSIQAAPQSPTKTPRTVEPEPKIRKSGELKSHNRKKSGNLARQSSPLSVANEIINVLHPHNSSSEGGERAKSPPLTDPRGWPELVHPVTEKFEPSKTQMAPADAGSRVGSGDPGETKAVHVKPSISTPETSLAQRINTDIDVSNADGAGDSLPAAIITKAKQMVQGLKSEKGAHDHSTDAPPKKVCKKHKKQGNQSKVSNHLQESRDSSYLQSTSNSENIKPRPDSQTKLAGNTFLDPAASPEYKDGAAKIHEAQLGVTESLAFIKSSSATADDQAQQVQAQLLAAAHSKKPAAENLARNTESPRTNLSEGATLAGKSSKQAESKGMGDAASVTSFHQGVEQSLPEVFQHGNSLAYGDGGMATKASIEEPSQSTLKRSDGSSFNRQVGPTDSAEALTSISHQDNHVANPDAVTAMTPLHIDKAEKKIRENGQATSSSAGYDGKTRLNNTMPNLDLADQEPRREKDNSAKTIPPEKGDRSANTTVQEEDTTSLDVDTDYKKLNGSAMLLTEGTKEQVRASEIGISPNTSKSGVYKSQENSLDKDASSTTLAPSSPIPPTVAPIQTRHKKKLKQFASSERIDTPELEEPLNMGDSPPIDKQEGTETNLYPEDAVKSPESTTTKMPKQKKKSKRKSKKSKKPAVLPDEPSQRTTSPDRKKLLPAPETPYQVDSSAKSPSNLNLEATSKDGGQMLDASSDSNFSTHHGNELLAGRILSSSPDDPSVVKATPLNSSAHGQEGIQAAMVEAGYHSSEAPSSSLHFAPNDRVLSRLDDLFAMKEEEYGNPQSYEVDHSSEVSDRVRDLKRQLEVTQLCKQVAEGRERQASGSATTPTKPPSQKELKKKEEPSLEALEESLEKTSAELILKKVLQGGRHPSKSPEDSGIWNASKLLNTSPRRDPGNLSPTDWSKLANDYIERETVNKNLSSSSSSQKTKANEADRSTASSTARPGSIRTIRPGSATMLVPLRRGEDASEIIARVKNNPDGFFGFDNHSKSQATPNPGPSSQTSPASQHILTPPSPQTVGRRTPSKEQEQELSNVLRDDKTDAIKIQGNPPIDEAQKELVEQDNGVRDPEAQSMVELFDTPDVLGAQEGEKLQIDLHFGDTSPATPMSGATDDKQNAGKRPESVEVTEMEKELPTSVPNPNVDMASQDSSLEHSNDSTNAGEDKAQRPNLTQGNVLALGGTKSASSPKNGYAAAVAKKSIDPKEETESNKQAGTSTLSDPQTRKDGWAVTGEATWGSRRGSKEST